MTKDTKFKRLMINNEMILIKVDTAIEDTIFVEKNEKDKSYNFYFPTDAKNKIYILGTSMPIDILDAYVAKRFDKGLCELDKNSGAKSALSGKSTKEEIEDILKG